MWAPGRIDIGALAVLALAAAGCTASTLAPRAARSAAQATPEILIPREAILGDPERIALSLSPDGNRIAFLGPHAGTLAMWVAPRAAPELAQPIGGRSAARTSRLEWAAGGKHLLLTHDETGKENQHVFA